MAFRVHLNLCVKFVHIIFIFEYEIFIMVSDFKSKALGPERQH